MNFLPFSYNWLIKKKLTRKKIKTILDLGCGRGEFGDAFNRSGKYKVTGVDVFEPYLKICSRSGKYSSLIKADLSKKLKFKNKSFDAVVCLETIEHLKKPISESLIKEIERIAKKLVVISCPAGEALQDSYDNNPHQKHLSSWSSAEFSKRGYSVSGVGLKLAYGNSTHVNEKISFFRKILMLVSFFFNPVSNFLPFISCQLVATKSWKA